MKTLIIREGQYRLGAICRAWPAVLFISREAS